MENYREEMTPVNYGTDAIKTARYIAKSGEIAFATHWHDRMELVLLRSGVLEVGYGTNIQILHSDEIYIIPPRMPHGAVCRSETAQWDVLMFDIRLFYNQVPLSREILASIFDGRAKYEMVLSNHEVVDCCRRIISLTNKNSFETIALIYSLIDLLLKHALLEISQDIKDVRAIQEITQYIKDNLDKELTTKELSEKCGYSEGYFCRLFKETTKVTPMNYIRIKRLDKAVNLLSTGKFSVGEVSALCGFSEPNYFTRCFKAYFGKPPTEYIGLSSPKNIIP